MNAPKLLQCCQTSLPVTCSRISTVSAASQRPPHSRMLAAPALATTCTYYCINMFGCLINASGGHGMDGGPAGYDNDGVDNDDGHVDNDDAHSGVDGVDNDNFSTQCVDLFSTKFVHIIVPPNFSTQFFQTTFPPNFSHDFSTQFFNSFSKLCEHFFKTFKHKYPFYTPL